MSAWALGIAGYLAVCAGVVGLAAAAHLRPNAVAPLGRVVARARARGWSRAVLLLTWAWLGWHLFVR